MGVRRRAREQHSPLSRRVCHRTCRQPPKAKSVLIVRLSLRRTLRLVRHHRGLWWISNYYAIWIAKLNVKKCVSQISFATSGVT